MTRAERRLPAHIRKAKVELPYAAGAVPSWTVWKNSIFTDVELVVKSRDTDHAPAGIVSEDDSGSVKKQARGMRADKVRVLLELPGDVLRLFQLGAQSGGAIPGKASRR